MSLGRGQLIQYMMQCLAIGDIKYRFSNGIRTTPKYINDPEAWDTTQRLMKDILDDIGWTM